MATYEIRLTHCACKDIKKLTPKLKEKLYEILATVIANSPYEGKKLIGDLKGSWSFRLTYRDRIVYSIDEAHKIIYIERAATHYGA